MPEMTAAQAQKKALRRPLLEKRHHFEPALVSRAICERITDSTMFRDAKVIFGYLAMPQEINIDPVLRAALAEGKTVDVPKLTATLGIMDAVELTSWDNLALNRWEIREPRDTAVIDPSEFDLVLAPGLAFTRNGARLGMGGGYYDRWLAHTNAKTLGICAEAFLVTQIPLTPNDVTVDAVVTETAWYTAR